MSGHQGLSVRALQVSFGRNHLLRGINLDVAAGETLVLFGPSGVGKTVLLRAIAGLEPAARGQVSIDGRDVSTRGPEARGIGMAFQNFALYPHMSARDNIASPLRARGVARVEIDRRVGAVADLLRIAHVLGHAPKELSNGQKQRTALARALVGEPGVLLLDDPLRNVDAKLRYEMRLELPRLLRNAGAATLYVTQDYREAMALGDRVAILLDGSIAQLAAPEEIYDRPAAMTVARLFGDPPINLLACRPADTPGGVQVTAAGLRLTVRAERSAAGRDCLLGLRPEAIAVHAEPRPGAAPAKVLAVTPLHERLVVLLHAGGAELVASVLGEVPAPDAPAWITAETAQAALFDPQSGARIPAPAPVREAA
ncbi:MAG: ABC transporter ATP-binding protein [Rhodospirillales bacterium]|nr:ABC transporter ATP-binding protein [Rhodospirillales bacterium]